MREPTRKQLYRFTRYLDNRLRTGETTPGIGWPDALIALLAICGPAVTSRDPEMYRRIAALIVLLVLLLAALTAVLLAVRWPMAGLAVLLL